METSKFFIAIQENNKSIQVMESKFERSVGDIMNIEGKKFKVCDLFESKAVAGYFLHTYKGHVFSFFDFNTKNGKKL